jgi:hypothetical protein
MRMIHCFIFAAVLLAATSLTAQQVEVDISACQGMDAVLKTMHDGAPKEKVSVMLDTLLDTRPYQVMFKHYNRSWRPNHLPKPVFKRMILSLQFQQEYAQGENERADAMRAQWTKFYPDLTPYESQLRQLEAADLHKLINDGVHYAQTWLPPGWQIPDSYFVVIPNGGSPAFSIEDAQGYDFLQLSHTRSGAIDLNWLVGTVAHESHHLGMKSSPPPGLSPREALAYQIVALCIPEGAATYFISGSPAGRAPAFADARFHIFTPDLNKAWDDLLPQEEDMVQRQTAMLDRALAGTLTEDAFDAELRDYWLNGAIGRAYVLGSDMLAAINLAFGKEGVFQAMQDPRQLFRLYNAALDAKPEVLKHCVRIPDKSVRQALSLGGGH